MQDNQEVNVDCLVKNLTTFKEITFFHSFERQFFAIFGFVLRLFFLVFEIILGYYCCPIGYGKNCLEKLPVQVAVLMV